MCWACSLIARSSMRATPAPGARPAPVTLPGRGEVVLIPQNPRCLRYQSGGGCETQHGNPLCMCPRGQVSACGSPPPRAVEAPAPPTNNCAVVVALGAPMAGQTSSGVAGPHRASSSAQPAPQRPYAAHGAGRDQQRDGQAASAAADGHLRPTAGSVRVKGKGPHSPKRRLGPAAIRACGCPVRSSGRRRVLRRNNP